MAVTGTPCQEDIESIDSPVITKILGQMPKTKPKSLHDMFPTADDDCIDMIQQLLNFNPDKRLTVEQCLEHPYVAQFHNMTEEISCKKTVVIPIDDNKKFSIREYRNKIYSDIMRKRK